MANTATVVVPPKIAPVTSQNKTPEIRVSPIVVESATLDEGKAS